jgi:hypothetical protein
MAMIRGAEKERERERERGKEGEERETDLARKGEIKRVEVGTLVWVE